MKRLFVLVSALLVAACTAAPAEVGSSEAPEPTPTHVVRWTPSPDPATAEPTLMPKPTGSCSNLPADYRAWLLGGLPGADAIGGSVVSSTGKWVVFVAPGPEHPDGGREWDTWNTPPRKWVFYVGAAPLVPGSETISIGYVRPDDPALQMIFYKVWWGEDLQELAMMAVREAQACVGG